MNEPNVKVCNDKDRKTWDDQVQTSLSACIVKVEKKLLAKYQEEKVIKSGSSGLSATYLVQSERQQQRVYSHVCDNFGS